MKIKTINLLLILTLCQTYGQEISFKYLGNEYEYTYKSIEKELKICILKENEEKCKKFDIDKDETFSLINSILKATESFSGEIKISTQLEKELKSLNLTSTSTLEAVKNLDESQQTIEVKNFLNDWRKEDNMEPKDLRVDQIIKENKERLSVQKVLQVLTHIEFEQQAKELYEKITDKYTFLTFQKLTMKSETKSKTTQDFVFDILIKKDQFGLMISFEKPRKSSFKRTISKEEFFVEFFRQNEFIEQDEPNKNKLTDVYISIKEKLEEEAKMEIKKDMQKISLSIIDSIEKEKKTYSGKLVLQESFNLNLLTNDKFRQSTNTLGGNKNLKEDRFITERATFRFFNNRIDIFSIYGHLKSKPDEKMVLFNEGYSSPLRELNKAMYNREKVFWKARKHFGNKKTGNKKGKDTQNYRKQKKFIVYSLADAIDYLPTDRFNYSIKNQELELEPNIPVQVEERNINDYFTGIFFSDFLGVNSSNSNNLIIAEGKARFPIHLRNWGITTIFDHFSGSVAISLFNGFNNTAKMLEIGRIDAVKEDKVNKMISDSLGKVASFDFLANNNLDASFEIAVFSLDWKQARTFVHFGYGFRFLRTGVSYDYKLQQTGEDTNTSTSTNFYSTEAFQAYTRGHQANLTFEFRPQSNIGADLVLGLNWLRGAGANLYNVKYDADFGKPYVKMMLDLFSTSAEKKSGVYFRMGGHYDFNGGHFFPQIMAGYATNLSSFVNKLKTDK